MISVLSIKLYLLDASINWTSLQQQRSSLGLKKFASTSERKLI